MFQKLFSRSKVDANNPHPLRVNFAHRTIPTLLEDKNRAAFLSVLISEEGQHYLQKTWQEVAEKSLASKDRLPAEGLEASVFKKDGYFYTFFHFPAPQRDGEPHFGVVVFHPPEGNDWNMESVEAAPYSYFTACASGVDITIWRLQDGSMITEDVSVELNKHKFIEWVKVQVTS